MGRNVLITIEIPISLRERVRAHWKKRKSAPDYKTSLRGFYSQVFKLGVETNEEAKHIGNSVPNHLGEN
jgi:hypothetical protein